MAMLEKNRGLKNRMPEVLTKLMGNRRSMHRKNQTGCQGAQAAKLRMFYKSFQVCFWFHPWETPILRALGESS